MRHGQNYIRYLEDELVGRRQVTEIAEKVSSQSEQAFQRLLPPDEDILNVTDESLKNPAIVAAREAFRGAHKTYFHARSYQAEIEDEYFVYPEDSH